MPTTNIIQPTTILVFTMMSCDLLGGKASLEEVGHLPSCCSDNYGGYDPAYGFMNSTYSCQDSPVEREFNIVHDTTSTTHWSFDQGLRVEDVYKVLGEVAADVSDSKAAVSMTTAATAIAPAGSALENYLLKDEIQRITFADQIIEEDKPTIARTRCFESEDRSCAHSECDMIVSASTYIDGDLWTLQYSASASAPEGNLASRKLSISLQWLMAHEMGHALGLGHPAGTLTNSETIMKDTMEPYIDMDDGNLSYTGLGSTDIEALRFLYGKR